jgi:hypothetical protein
MTKEYAEYLLSPEWIKIRRLVKNRDHKQCVWCGAKRALRVHHLTYEHIYKELEFLDDLVTICKNCHAWIHEKHDSPQEINKTERKRIKPPKGKRLPISERRTLRKAFILSQTATEYKVQFCCNKVILVLQKSDCEITKWEKTYYGEINSIKFPALIWKEVQKERRLQRKLSKIPADYGRK